MKVLWRTGQGTVQEIRDDLFPKRPLAYTTVMTVMDRLARKGAAEREKRGRAHVYRPAIARELVRERALTRLLEDFFQGSREQLRQHLDSPAAPLLERAPGPSVEVPVQQPAGPRTHATGAPREHIDTSLL